MGLYEYDSDEGVVMRNPASPVPGSAAAPETARPTPTASGAGPYPAVEVWCTELELSEPVGGELTPPPGAAVRVLARMHRVPIGFLTLERGAPTTVAAVTATALAELADPVRRHLAEDGRPVGPGEDLAGAVRLPCPRPVLDDHVSVVVGTRNRPGHVRECLARLLDLEHASFDVIVVDNAPATEETRDAFLEAVGGDDRFRYLRLDRPGVSRARNAGIAAARGPLVAFIDDDVRVDSCWLQGLVRAFARVPSAVCVTGLVATQAIAGPEQRYFDSRVSWAASLEPRVFHPSSEDPLHPWAAGRFGAGANMAFRLEAICALHGFDEDLGPGTIAKGGEDIDLFVRALRAGGDLMYDPAALAWHVHRSEAADLEKQMYGYGVGLTAYLVKHASTPSVALEMARKLVPGLRHVLRVTHAPQRSGLPSAAARRYRRIELTGMLFGPSYYLRSKLAARRGRAER